MNRTVKEVIKKANAIPATAPIEERFHDLLNQMVDELADCGVDVSYFPESAHEVLRKYASRLAVEKS